jgi:plastocyanin
MPTNGIKRIYKEKEMNAFNSIRHSGIFRSGIFRSIFVLAVLILPQIAQAQWRATVGAQSESLGRQALAFLPNELWIHTGDSVTWTFDADEIHTVTFQKAGQTRLAFQVGCPGFAPGGSGSFDGTICISTPALAKGQSFTITFPTAGNFKLVCLVHANMTGVVHVLDLSQPLPYGQDFYDDQAAEQRKSLLSDDDHDHDRDHHHDSGDSRSGINTVMAGVGEVTANGGGFQTLIVARFMEPTKVIHAGETVEWTNFDPLARHTITFGVEPLNPVPPVNVTKDTDGALHGIVNSNADNVHSGVIGAAPQDQVSLPAPPLGVTRFRVTFTHPGVFPYICALHDGLGMKGTVIVIP